MKYTLLTSAACGPCQQIKPLIAKDYPAVEVLTITPESVKDVRSRFGNVQSVPQLALGDEIVAKDAMSIMGYLKANYGKESA